MARKYDPQKIVDYLKINGASTPTKIGMDVFGLSYDRASGTACAILNELKRAKRVKKVGRGIWVAV